MAKTAMVLPVLVALIAVINVCSAILPHYCRQPPVTGVCRARLQRYFFNWRRGRCESFTYGGCRGNNNRFMSERACTAACSSHRSNVCSLPKVIGRCRAAIPRYYLNQASGQCERFIYGGCGGNANNFRSLGMCQRRCHSSYSRPRRAATPSLTVQECSQPPQTGPCKAYIPSFYFNSSTNSCKSFVYGGCRGNTNRFPNEEQCMRACGSIGGSIIGGGLRSGNPNPGRGNDRSPRKRVRGSIWAPSLAPFFQRLAKKFFSLRGSRSREGGIGPAFLPEAFPVTSRRNTTNAPEISQASGNESLGASVTPTPTLVIDFPLGKHVCQMPKDPGSCFAAFAMFFYNKTADTCEPFTYGGCQGNGNRFESKEWCEMTCKTTIPPAFDTNDCLLPRKTGRCRAYFKRFYFNAASGRCEEFVYGGCQGNNNRFKTLRECRGKCNGVRRTA